LDSFLAVRGISAKKMVLYLVFRQEEGVVSTAPEEKIQRGRVWAVGDT